MRRHDFITLLGGAAVGLKRQAARPLPAARFSAGRTANAIPTNEAPRGRRSPFCLVEQGYGVCGARDEPAHAGQQQQLVDQLCHDSPPPGVAPAKPQLGAGTLVPRRTYTRDVDACTDTWPRPRARRRWRCSHTPRGGNGGNKKACRPDCPERFRTDRAG
jgi:hypothetical protein